MRLSAMLALLCMVGLVGAAQAADLDGSTVSPGQPSAKLGGSDLERMPLITSPDEKLIQGQVIDYKTVDMDNEKDHRVVQIKLKNGQTEQVDLGTKSNLPSGFDLRKGQWVLVAGVPSNLGNQPVFVAHRFANVYNLPTAGGTPSNPTENPPGQSDQGSPAAAGQDGATRRSGDLGHMPLIMSSDEKLIEGQVIDYKTVDMDSEKDHRVVQIKLKNGQTEQVDLGIKSDLPSGFDMAKGQWVLVAGVPSNLGSQQVFVAHRWANVYNLATGGGTPSKPTENLPGVSKAGVVKGEDKAVRDGVPAPDNSAVNERDRARDAKTAGAQGQGKTDVQLTADIRKQVVKTDMSTNAHNSKIVTQNGKVTLRGPVKTQEEKDTIGRIAVEVAGADNVDNQLEVQDKAAY